jgi:hypothetical protein
MQRHWHATAPRAVARVRLANNVVLKFSTQMLWGV